MHRKIRQIEIGIFFFTLCLGFSRFTQAGEPLNLVRTAVDKAIQILKDPKLQSQDKKRERIDRLSKQMFFTSSFQMTMFLLLFISFAIKLPMVPFHTWLPDAHVEAPTAGSVILAGVLLKMGTYGFLRFSLPILPEATKYFVPMMVTLSIIAIVYGALVAMVQ